MFSFRCRFCIAHRGVKLVLFSLANGHQTFSEQQVLLVGCSERKFRTIWAIAEYYKMPVKLLMFDIAVSLRCVCVSVCVEGGGRTPAPFTLKNSSLTEKAHCGRAQKSSMLSTTPRRRRSYSRSVSWWWCTYKCM